MGVSDLRFLGSLAVGLSIAACGSSPDPRTHVDDMLNLADQQAELYDAMADAMAGIDSQVAANAFAERFRSEFLPRHVELLQSSIAVVESIASLPEDQRQEIVALQEEWEEQAQTRFQRVDRALKRMDDRLSRVEPRFMTSALEESIVTFHQTTARYDEQLQEVQRSAVVAEDAAGPNDDRTWCESMANKPQAQWTMNEAFAYANRCVGR